MFLALPNPTALAPTDIFPRKDGESLAYSPSILLPTYNMFIHTTIARLSHPQEGTWGYLLARTSTKPYHLLHIFQSSLPARGLQASPRPTCWACSVSMRLSWSAI